jgi:Zn-dependent peptidase ImmA (M78 family)/predicted secreted protein
MTARDAILEGAHAAAEVHERLHSRKTADESGGGIDVFGALLASDAALIFRPLEGLLGFCIKGPSQPGVVISTQRPLRIQRFTGAHELGHVALGHTISLDGPEILARGGELHNDVEISANSFASAFLLPKWLLQIHARRQNWNGKSMTDPFVVYQMSLRIGASYEATCVALAQHKIIDEGTRRNLVDVPRRKIKAELLDGFEVENYFPDVWVLTEKDEGLTLEGQPDDLFILRVRERGGAGYLWNTDGLRKSGFAILGDERDIPSPETGVGAPVLRTFTIRSQKPSSGSFDLEQRRPWQKTVKPLSSLHVAYDVFGKEVGLPRAARRQLARA